MPEIAGRVGKRPRTVERILEMIELKKRAGVSARSTRAAGLRPVERVVLRLRESGLSYGEVGNRLGRSGAHIRRIESYARLKSPG